MKFRWLWNAHCPKYIIDLKFGKIDYRGIILLSMGLFLLTYAVNEVQNWGLISTLFFGGWLGPSFLPPVFWFLFKTFFFICVD